MGDQHQVAVVNAGRAPAQPPRPNVQLSSTWASCGEVQHISNLSDDLSQLCASDLYADVTLVVGHSEYPAHRVLLAARSEYFRALLYGGLRETAADRIELHDTHGQAFSALLRYIYTGKASLTNQKEELILEILGLAHKYGFSDLENAVSEYLKAVLNARNLCTVFGASHLYSLGSLQAHCLQYADRAAPEVLASDGFLQLSVGAVEQLISRDSFCAPEIDVFRAVRHWAKTNSTGIQEGCLKKLVGHVRLSLMKLEDLLNVVRPSCLFTPDSILDAIKEQKEKRSSELRYRGFMMPDLNLATSTQGAQVIEGELKQALLNGDSHNYDMERGFTRHPIEDKASGIEVELGLQCIINHIRLLLWDKDSRSYSYFVEVSMDRHDWRRVVDHSAFLCRSWQNLYFSPAVVRYIRVVGTHNTVNKVFHLVTLEAYYKEAIFSIDDVTGLMIASENVATVERAASVIEGVSRSRNALLNGDTQSYDWDNGYTCHQLGSGAIVVQLAQPYIISSARLLLWDCDDRAYSYYIEVSTDQTVWKRVIDRSLQACRVLDCPQKLADFGLSPRSRYVSNEVFHCVHFECPAPAAALAEFVHTQNGCMLPSEAPSAGAINPGMAPSVNLLSSRPAVQNAPSPTRSVPGRFPGVENCAMGIGGEESAPSSSGLAAASLPNRMVSNEGVTLRISSTNPVAVGSSQADNSRRNECGDNHMQRSHSSQPVSGANVQQLPFEVHQASESEQSDVEIN